MHSFKNQFKDTFIKSETIHRPDIRTLQTTLSCALEEANNSEADSGAHSGNSSPSKSSSGSSMDVTGEYKLEEKPSTPSTPASSAASVASFNLAIQGATMAIMRQRHWSHITEFPIETSNSVTPPKSPTSFTKNKSDQNLLDDEKSETGEEVREEDFSAINETEPSVLKPPLKKQNSRFSVTPVAVVLPVEKAEELKPEVTTPEVKKMEQTTPEVKTPVVKSPQTKQPVTRQISRFRVTSISEDPDPLPPVPSVSNVPAEMKTSTSSIDDVSIVFLEPNQPPDKNKRPSIEIEKSQNIPKIIDQMVSNMQMTQE